MLEPPSIFLISPANLGGRRGALLFNPSAPFQLARELRSPEGAALGELFSFVSGLYFRGKLAYARAFGRAPLGHEAAYVMSAGGGLCSADERIRLERLQGWAKISIHQDNPHFSAPLIRHASALLERSAPGTRFVLLGSVASDKYVQPLREVFGSDLVFPAQFAGLGDMSRGALLLRAVRDRRELAYAPIPAGRGSAPASNS
ncbi:MAG TPA: hypothetical protein VJV79_13265 [Polyangiaceae bacterium]|nr:hypothetical protein [Polyangiaceae bacterium]